MYCVYILKSKKDKKSTYIGYTKNIKKRFEQHNSKENTSTKYLTPWEIIYCEIYKSEKDARRREINLKQHGSALGHLKKRIKHSLL